MAGLIDDKEFPSQGLLEEKPRRDRTLSEDESGYSKITRNKNQHDLNIPNIVPDNSWTRDLSSQFKTVMDHHADSFRNHNLLPMRDHGVRPDLVSHMAAGGVIRGHAGQDDRNIQGQDGEFVVNAESAERNRSLLQNINSGQAAPVTLENAGKLPEQIGIEMKKVMDIEVKKLEDKLEDTKSKDGGIGDGLMKVLIDQGAKHVTENANWDQIGKDLKESKIGGMAKKGLDWAGDTGVGKFAKGTFEKVKNWWGGDEEEAVEPKANKGKYGKEFDEKYGGKNFLESEEAAPKKSETEGVKTAVDEAKADVTKSKDLGKGDRSILGKKEAGGLENLVKGGGAETGMASNAAAGEAVTSAAGGGYEAEMAALALLSGGGEVPGDPGVGDNVPIKATAGEFVVNKDSAQQNKGLLEDINNGKGFAEGGMIGSDGSRHYAGGGVISGFAGGLADSGQNAQKSVLGGDLPVIGGLISGVVDQLNAPFNKLKELVFKVTDTFEDLIHRGIDPATEIMAQIAPVVGQVAKFNPAVVERMQLAFDNVSAAAGSMFQPVVEEATKFANDLNVLYTSIAGPVRELVGGISTEVGDFAREFAIGFTDLLDTTITAIEPLTSAFKESGGVIGGIFKGSMEAIGVVIWALTPIFWGLGKVVQVVVGAFEILSTVVKTLSFGLGTPKGGAAENFEGQKPGQGLVGGMTIAAQPARQVGVEEIGQQARASAFSQGTGVQEKIASNTEKTNSLLDILIGILSRGKNLHPAGSVAPAMS